MSLLHKIKTLLVERKRKILQAGLFMLMGLGAATYLHWPALTIPTVYKSDVRQSPHWFAYHTDTFQDDDLILTLASHNESPVQNLIYFVGTYVFGVITLGKWLAVIGYGLTSALFFWIGCSMFGFRGGALASVCFTFFPDQFEYFAGGFSKAWMIPLILIGVYLLENRSWRGLLLLMPFAAAAYPVCAVFLGALSLTFLLLDAREHGRQVLPALGYLGGASGLALAVLSVKYLHPPEGIGSLTDGAALRLMPEMYEGGLSSYLPVPPLYEEFMLYALNMFVLGSALVFLVFLRRRGLWWSRAMTALLITSSVGYVVADIAFMHFYVPNRYTRYSLAVLLALWHAANWDRVLGRVPTRVVRSLALVALLAWGGYSYHADFKMGKDAWERGQWLPFTDFFESLPPKILVAGHPLYLDDIPVLAGRSVLCNYKLAHVWYSEYYAEVRRRTRATFDALYATSPEPVNRLAREWGVTHLVVVKRYLTTKRVRARNTYVNPYNDYIFDIAASKSSFLLSSPPPENIVFEDHELFVVQLPLED